MQTRMVSTQSPRSEQAIPTNKKYKKLSKEDEVAAGGDENEVRREDQEKINRFSRLHQRESVLEALLQGKQVRFSLSFQTPICHEMGDAKPEQKDKEDLEEITTELELADEDELVPYVLSYVLSLSLSLFITSRVFN